MLDGMLESEDARCVCIQALTMFMVQPIMIHHLLSICQYFLWRLIVIEFSILAEICLQAFHTIQRHFKHGTSLNILLL